MVTTAAPEQETARFSWQPHWRQSFPHGLTKGFESLAFGLILLRLGQSIPCFVLATGQDETTSSDGATSTIESRMNETARLLLLGTCL